MPKTTALAAFQHPTTGEPVAAGAEIALTDEEYYALRANGAVAATPAEWQEHQTAEATEGHYTARTGRADVGDEADEPAPKARKS